MSTNTQHKHVDVPVELFRFPDAKGRPIGTVAAVLLAKIMERTDQQPEGFVYPVAQIQHETGLTRDEQLTARRKLAAAGYIEEWKAAFGNLLHFKANTERIEQQRRQQGERA